VSASSQFARYQHFIEKFPSERQEISILVRADTQFAEQDGLLNADALSVLLSLHDGLERVAGVAHAVSVFSVPRLRYLA
jgi:predicted RND superfamily exporter protein